jgi:hypothetical protein
MPIRIRVRGSSSNVDFQKKSYALRGLAELSPGAEKAKFKFMGEPSAAAAAAAAWHCMWSSAADRMTCQQASLPASPPCLSHAPSLAAGFPNHDSFVMYGPQGDHSMLRNWMAFGFWRRTDR